MTEDQQPAIQCFNHLDYRAIGDELRKVKRELDSDRSEADFRHLRKIERWGRLCGVLGYATAWIVPNPISAFLISQGNFTRWTMVTHHVTHRGYDKTPGVPRRYTSKHSARGWQTTKSNITFGLICRCGNTSRFNRASKPSAKSTTYHTYRKACSRGS